MTTFHLHYKWSVSRAQDTYGYNTVTLYVDGRKVARCNGGGYDMEGTVLGIWVAGRFAAALCRRIKSKWYGLTFHDPTFNVAEAEVPGTGETVEAREKAGKSLGLERYRAFYLGSSDVPTKKHTVPEMDGACGKDCMIRILRAIGGKWEKAHSETNLTVELVTVPDRIASMKEKKRVH